ncbi:Trk system potassium uptake protein [Leishmania major strain Friedlin]|uniref:Trk system potassium uptake protein n=1 Tax=Leishmania major TaxID=5664 RepID=E9AEI5_LEIMA|nr:Trk system potassium uptake protein [Leishmania major strain Friedlin]CAG9582360.1 Trk_system_potassium_uptake_protein [Leishmania major strain Friedlin]CBZ12638.1 Trk system potassium uptake protein [Leishmania major strain Friedlin]|eukprot:XP_003722405.1 Trk system potassium uptake protein [Leishmania major strain Friedlin]
MPSGVNVPATLHRQVLPFEGGEQPPLTPLPTAPRDDYSRTSQLLFEVPVLLPLTADQRHLIKQLDFFKKWYLFCHFVYICTWILIGFLGLLAMVPHLATVDAFFVAVSSVCNCGLQSVDVGEWSAGATLFRHFLLLPGGVVITSSFQPLLRLFMLHRVRHVFYPEEKDTPQEALLRTKKRAEARRLHYAALVSAITPFVYFVVVNGALMTLLWDLNVSHLSAFDVFCMTLASFHSSIFLPMEAYARDAAVTGLVTAACALGFTAFPVLLRFFMLCEWCLLWAVRRLTGLLCRCVELCRSPLDDTSDGEERSASETEDISAALLHAPSHHSYSLLRCLDNMDAAFREAMSSKEPGTFHPFLFRPSETVFLGFAWCALTLMQAAPFWYEQWDGVLHGHTWQYKIYLSLCQAAVVRFAAASFVPLLEYSNAHVAVTILAMYLPALPISTDRTYRKWRQMFRTSVVRLLTSRLFWLFTGMVLILFAEEAEMRAQLLKSRFDIMTRTLFEVISAYAGCGLSLSLPDSNVSFVGCTDSFCKLIIAAVILGGRHRFVDLGIDLGFSSLQSDVDATSSSERISSSQM